MQSRITGGNICRISGGIYSGVFTVTEAASVGASLALIMALLAGQLTWESFVDCLLEAAGSTCMIFVILIGASIFSYFISLSGAPDALIEFIRSLGLAPLLVIVLLMIMYVVLGSVFDTVAAMVITLPFVLPLVVELGYNPVWWGIVLVMAIEVGMITPPIGMNVFVLFGVAGNIPLKTIFKGIMPFFYADVIRILIIILFPALALWLPEVLGYNIGD